MYYKKKRKGRTTNYVTGRVIKLALPLELITASGVDINIKLHVMDNEQQGSLTIFYKNNKK